MYPERQCDCFHRVNIPLRAIEKFKIKKKKKKITKPTKKVITK